MCFLLREFYRTFLLENLQTSPYLIAPFPHLPAPRSSESSKTGEPSPLGPLGATSNMIWKIIDQQNPRWSYKPKRLHGKQNNP